MAAILSTFNCDNLLLGKGDCMWEFGCVCVWMCFI